MLTEAFQYTFLGTGWTVGLASEAALKLRESARLWAESYPAMEYRHGPIAVSGPGGLVWRFGPAPDGLADGVAATGGTMWYRSRRCWVGRPGWGLDWGMSIRWLSWCGCTGWRSRSPGPPGSIRTGLGT